MHGLARLLAPLTVLAALWAAPPVHAVTVNEFAVPGAGSAPFDIATGSDGALWFTQSGGHQVGRITTGGVITEFPFDTANSGPRGITLGGDNNVWAAQNAIDKLARVTTAGAVDEFSTGAGAQPLGLTGANDGNIWWASQAGSFVGRMTTAGSASVFTGFGVAGTKLREVTPGLGARLWATDDGAGRVIPFTTNGAAGTETALPGGAASLPRGIVLGPDNAVWFTEAGANKIGRLTAPGAANLTEFTVPTAASEPDSITVGPDGALWFTESAARKIGRINTAGQITEFPLPSGAAGLGGITTGPDGALWFAETGADRIGRLVPDPPSNGVTTSFVTVAGAAAPGAPTTTFTPSTDRSGPSITLSTDGSVSVSELLKGLLVSATPGEPSELLFELLSKPRSTKIAATGDLVLASRKLPLAAGRRSTRLKPRRRLLGKPRRSFRLTVRTTATDVAGNRTVSNRRIRVKIRRKRRR